MSSEYCTVSSAVISPRPSTLLAAKPRLLSSKSGNVFICSPSQARRGQSNSSSSLTQSTWPSQTLALDIQIDVSLQLYSSKLSHSRQFIPCNGMNSISHTLFLSLSISFFFFLSLSIYLSLTLSFSLYLFFSLSLRLMCLCSCIRSICYILDNLLYEVELSFSFSLSISLSLLPSLSLTLFLSRSPSNPPSIQI